MNNLKEARKKAGMTQKQVAEHIGISQNAYSYWESGRNNVDSESMKKLSDLFNVSIDYLLGRDTPAQAPAPVELRASRGVKIPVLGYVRAGIPLDAVEEIIDYEEITPGLAATGEFFGLVIKGDSMHPVLQDGDVVIVRCQPDAETGDVVVALVNGDDATVKKLKKTETGIMLIPENRDYEPFFYDAKDVEYLPVAIIGKVTELRRKF